jgi:protein-tyrosine kinase
MKPDTELIVESLSPLGSSGAIAFLAPGPAEDTVAVPFSLAQALSKYVSSNVLLIDGGARRPALHTELSIAESPGLAEILSGAASIDDAVVSREGWFDVLTAGRSEARDFKAMAGEKFASLLKRLNARYDFVLFHMGAVSHFPAMAQTLSHFSGAVITVNCESTRWEVAQRLKGNLESAGVRVYGVILNERKFYIPNWLYKFV